MPTEKFAIRNRWTNAVQFEAEIECAPDAPLSWKLRLAVLWARLNGANLRGSDLRCSNLSDSNLRGSDLRCSDLRDSDLSGSDLRGCNLRGSDLRGSDLRYSNLRDSDLRGCNLSGSDLSGSDLRCSDLRDSDLRPFKADLWMTLSQARAEVPAFIAALREGRVDGSQYEGECACLVGTLANARGAPYHDAFPDCDADNPAEQWFLMIRKGDKPGDDTGGGFAAGKALEWALEYCALTGIEIDPEPAAQAEAA